MLNDERKTPAQRRQDERVVYLRDLVYFKMAPGAIARKLEVDLATVKRWLAGTSRVPLAAVLALEALQGRLPNMGRHWAWEGCTIDYDGNLWVPGWRVSWNPTHMQQDVWLRSSVEQLRRENDKLRAEVQRLQDELAKTDTAANDGQAWRHGWPEPLPEPLMDVTPKRRATRK